MSFLVKTISVILLLFCSNAQAQITKAQEASIRNLLNLQPADRIDSLSLFGTALAWFELNGDEEYVIEMDQNGENLATRVLFKGPMVRELRFNAGLLSVVDGVNYEYRVQVKAKVPKSPNVTIISYYFFNVGGGKKKLLGNAVFETNRAEQYPSHDFGVDAQGRMYTFSGSQRACLEALSHFESQEE